MPVTVPRVNSYVMASVVTSRVLGVMAIISMLLGQGCANGSGSHPASSASAGNPGAQASSAATAASTITSSVAAGSTSPAPAASGMSNVEAIRLSRDLTSGDASTVAGAVVVPKGSSLPAELLAQL